MTYQVYIDEALWSNLAIALFIFQKPKPSIFDPILISLSQVGEMKQI